MSDRDDNQLSEEDRKRTAETVQKIERLAVILKSVMPEASDDEIGTTAHDIADYWELSVRHQERMEQLLQLEGRGDRQKLADLLGDLVYGDVMELKYHSESMETTLPRVITRLESEL